MDLCLSIPDRLTDSTIYVTEKGSTRKALVTYGTGPLACLSLFPVAELDKEGIMGLRNEVGLYLFL